MKKQSKFIKIFIILIIILCIPVIINICKPKNEVEINELFSLCKPPCWLGITPGETERETAIQLLQESPFVIEGSFEFGETPEHPLVQQGISFELTNGRMGLIGLSNDKVVYMMTKWESSLGEALDIFGEPDWLVGLSIREVDGYGVNLFYDQGIHIAGSSLQNINDNHQENSSGEIFVYPEMRFTYVEFFDPDMFQSLREYFELRFGYDPDYAITLDEISVPWEGYGFYISLRQ